MKNKREKILRRNISSNAIASILFLLMLISVFAELIPSVTYAQPESMTFTSGERISFTSTTEMEFKTGNIMQFWSGEMMKFGTNITIRFREFPPPGDGFLYACDIIQVTWSLPPGYEPPECSWWEVINPADGRLLGEMHIDGRQGPTEWHVDMVWPDAPIIFPGGPGSELIAKKKIDRIGPCDSFEVHWPSHWWPQPCTWWEIMDPETGEPTGYEFHVGWTN